MDWASGAQCAYACCVVILLLRNAWPVAYDIPPSAWPGSAGDAGGGGGAFGGGGNGGGPNCNGRFEMIFDMVRFGSLFHLVARRYMLIQTEYCLSVEREG